MYRFIILASVILLGAKCDNITDPLLEFIGPIKLELSDTIQILKNFKTEKSTSISQQRDQTGFKMIHNVYDYGSGTVYDHKFNQLLDIWLSDKKFNSLSIDHKNKLIDSLKELSLQVMEEPFHKKHFELSFNDGHGNLFMLIFSLVRHPTKASLLQWQKFMLWSEFEPAPSYVIITNRNCNIMRCKVDDKIRFLPVTITDAHMKSLIDLNINLMTDFSNKMFFIDKQ